MKLINEIVLIRNYVGEAIDDGRGLTMNDLNELWQWLDTLLGEEE